MNALINYNILYIDILQDRMFQNYDSKVKRKSIKLIVIIFMKSNHIIIMSSNFLLSSHLSKMQTIKN